MFNDQSQVTPESNPEGNANPQPSNPSSSFDTLLSEIKNDRGEPKYRSVEDGLTALRHSQEHIRSLTSERARLESELEEYKNRMKEVESLKETVQKLTQRSTEPEQRENQFDEETIANLVDTRLSIRQRQEAEAANQRAVAQKLRDTFGDKAKDSFYEKASQLGFSPDEFEALAAKSPRAVLTMFNIDGDGAPRQPNKSPVPSRVNSESFQGKPTSFIGAETEHVPLGGGTKEYARILENSRNMVEELAQHGMSIGDLTDPANYMKYFNNKG